MSATRNYQRHVLTWYALGRVQEARAARAAMNPYRDLWLHEDSRTAGTSAPRHTARPGFATGGWQMRANGIVRRRLARVLIVVTVAAAGMLLLASTSPALAGQVGVQSGRWSLSAIKQGVGEVPLAHGRVPTTTLFEKKVDLGPTAFNFAFSPVPDRAADWVGDTTEEYFTEAEAPSIAPDRPLVVKGGATHLESYLAFEKSAPGGVLNFQLHNLVLNMTDVEGPLQPSECHAPPCYPIRTIVRYHVRAWTVAGGHEFFNVGGTVFAEGHDQQWFMGAATAADARAPFWTDAQFHIDQPHGATAFHMSLQHALDLNVPLTRLHRGTLFMTKLTMDAEAIDDRGGESAAQAFVTDPPRPGTGVVARGLTPRRAQNLKEPPVTPRPAARCPRGPRRHAGTLQLSSEPMSAGEGSGTALVLVTREGGSHGASSVIVNTSGDTARSGVDFKRTKTLVRFENGDTSPRLVEVPIREDLTREPPEKFSISLSQPHCASLGRQRTAPVTILDDDQPPSPPPPTFRIGGTVDGLQGSGLVLSNLGDDVPVSANGSFTFPRTAVNGQSYETGVRTQPTNPDQICTVEHGKGTVSIANVTDIAVHCRTVVVPSGLDPSFGDHGRVTTPGNGDGRAVLIQSDGKIVTVGPREVGVNFHFQFGATRHDANGNLDPSFGTGGIATTSLGGNDDKARDAALMPDGGFVAVGQADPAGLANVDFGVVRYTADGHPDPTFNSTGVETTDIAGRGDVANAVAVQPDGKIVAAGEAETAPGFFDFAVVRYNPDGTLDTSFGGDGIVTTDLGTEFDDATAIAIQPDGKIVVAGDTDQNVALARYLPNGTLDPTFNAGGTVVSNIGTNEANGVAITAGGTILIAGTRVGPKGNRDPFVASFGPNGKLNLGFGTFGVAEADISGGEDFGNDLALDANGNIVVVGSASSATVSDMALVRFKPDGTLDTSLTTDFRGTGDFGNALAIDPEGRIVAAGTSGDQFALTRAFL